MNFGRGNDSALPSLLGMHTLWHGARSAAVRIVAPPPRLSGMIAKFLRRSGQWVTMPLGSLTRRSVSKAAGIHSGLSRHQLKFQ
jgi:hypothetical protein